MKSGARGSFFVRYGVRFACVCALAAAAFALGASLAGAAVLPSVETTRTFLGKNNQPVTVAAGLDRADVIALLKANYGATTKPQLKGLTLVIDSKSLKLTAKELKTLTPKIDFNALADALLASGKPEGTQIDTNALIAKTVATSKIDALVKTYAKATATAPLDIRYIYDKKTKKLAIAPAKDGAKLATKDGRAGILAALAQLAAKPNATGSVKTAKLTRAKVAPAKTTRNQMGKGLLVSLSQRRIWLYDKGKRTTMTYRVAIGMKGFGTPAGWYYVGAKRPHPTWSNPGSAWAKNMPATIGPGPGNPLGLRAMNLYDARGHDTGYRIHGTSKLSSIGTAASHGCIRVANANIVKLYNKTPVGTPVIVQP